MQVERAAVDRIQAKLATMSHQERAQLALKVRELYEMSQKEFAAFLGLTVGTVSRRERAAMSIPDDAVRALQFAQQLHAVNRRRARARTRKT